MRAPGQAAMALAKGTLWIGGCGSLRFGCGLGLVVVTSLSLVTGAMPAARGTTIAAANAVGTVARGTGTIASGWLFGVHGVEGTLTLSVIAAASAATAFMLSRRRRA